ncbi:Electron transfer flavoprotein subunit alpha [Azospirillaceae bacterium]
MAVLVIVEHDNAQMKSVILTTISAAAKLSDDIHLLVAGSSCGAVADAAARISGVKKVLVCDAPQYAAALPENLAPLIVGLAQGYTHILAPATSAGKNVSPRIAALLDVAQISEITGVKSPDIFERPIYAGSAIATVQSSDSIKVITVRGTAFEPVIDSGGAAVIEAIAPIAANDSVRFIGQELSKSDRPELTSARVVVTGGRGLQSAENFKLLEVLADKLNGAVGATRAAVDAGFIANDAQIGQTGKIVAPELYIAVGVSGAIQHVAGIKDSKIIVAINKDEEAPIFQIADYGLVADLFKAVPELTAAI